MKQWTWTHHAARRAQERFPELSLVELEVKLETARNIGRRDRQLMKRLCPISWKSHIDDKQFKVKFWRITRDKMVFVTDLHARIVTVFQMRETT